MNTIKLKIGQNSISNSIVKSKYTQNIDTSEVKNLFGDSKLIDDYFLKGGYKVVSDIDCRNNISCEYRKLGMQVMVVGPDASFKKYVLKGNDPCSNEGWEELTNPTDEVGAKLVEDYSVLGDSLNTQRDLNLKLKQLILNLQTQIDLIELSDEKVQITEDTSFAQIGQTQKDFNKNVSDYKTNSDLKNQEQDERLTNIKDKTTDIVVATTTVGAINAGETIPAGTNIQKLTELLFDKTFYPTFVDPTFSLTSNAGNKPKEVGSLANITLTFNFNQGQILGKLVNGIWDEDEQQDYRAGAATSYSLNGVSSLNNSASFNVTTSFGTNKFDGTVTYGEGAQPKDSKGNLFGSPYGGGISPIQSTSFEGIYPYFYYKSKSKITPAIMQSAIANGQAIKVVASSIGIITIPFKADGEYIAVAYPATSTTKKAWYVTEVDKGKLSTSPTMPSGITDQLFQSNIIAATNQYAGLDRIFLIDSGEIKGFPSAFPSYSASSIASGPINSKPFDRTVTNYLYISITLANSADQARLEGIQLTNS